MLQGTTEQPRSARLGWGLLLEAFCSMLAARVLLRVLPARLILGWQQRPVRRPSQSDPASDRALRASVRRAVLAVVRRSPFALVCFPQCLAASSMLRRRGLGSRLHYGIGRSSLDAALMTHTWLESGGEFLVGGEIREAFATLAVYPSGDSPVSLAATAEEQQP